VPQSAPVTPNIQHRPTNGTNSASSLSKAGPPVPGSAPTTSRAPHPSQSSQNDKSPVKAVPRSLNQGVNPAQYPGSPPPDRPEAAMKKIKQRQLDHRTKEFAMDDTKATMCYECDTPFGMLVRRQHCRTCGQIFCSKCVRFDYQGTIQFSIFLHFLGHSGALARPLLAKFLVSMAPFEFATFAGTSYRTQTLPLISIRLLIRQVQPQRQHARPIC
jgi:hypothetical protein